MLVAASECDDDLGRLAGEEAASVIFLQRAVDFVIELCIARNVAVGHAADAPAAHEERLALNFADRGDEVEGLVILPRAPVELGLGPRQRDR